MPLSSTSPKHMYVLQNGALILLAIFCWPICTFIVICSQLISPFFEITKHIQHHRKWRQISSSAFRPRTVLVTGMGMSKGLSLARIFYRAGHRVVGADFEPYPIPVPGHFSKSLDIFYRLSDPTSDNGSARYVRDLVDVIKKEKVELWVSCSGEASTIADGEAAEVIEKETSCRVIQFGPTLTETLHEKHSFISHTIDLHLNVPETHLVTSETEALAKLFLDKASTAFIMKSVRFDGPTHADMTILPRPSFKETEAHIKQLNPTPFRPFVLQQYIAGPEYCTYALVIKGEIKAFVACPSANLLMHYQSLPTSSLLSRAMLLYITLYVRRTSSTMTGHFCLDFLVEESLARQSELRTGATEMEVRELMGKINPIECNPRPNTAVICFEDVSEDMADAYLSILPDHEPKGISNGHRVETMVIPKPGMKGYYWIGHDLVTRVLLPALFFLRFEIGLRELVGKWIEFAEHVIYWRDAVWEVWDPWPAWWLYVGYWPLMFCLAVWKGRWWSRVNISTGKMFGCQ